MILLAIIGYALCAACIVGILGAAPYNWYHAEKRIKELTKNR